MLAWNGHCPPSEVTPLIVVCLRRTTPPLGSFTAFSSLYAALSPTPDLYTFSGVSTGTAAAVDVVPGFASRFTFFRSPRYVFECSPLLADFAISDFSALVVLALFSSVRCDRLSCTCVHLFFNRIRRYVTTLRASTGTHPSPRAYSTVHTGPRASPQYLAALFNAQHASTYSPTPNPSRRHLCHRLPSRLRFTVIFVRVVDTSKLRDPIDDEGGRSLPCPLLTKINRIQWRAAHMFHGTNC